MRNWLLELLKALEVRIPAPRGSHHGITCCRYGNDTTGWEDHLGLHVHSLQTGKWHTFFLDDEDFYKEPAVLSGEIVSLMSNETDKRSGTNG